MPLRDYQVRVINELEEAVESGRKRILAQLPTGGGKSVVARELADRRAKRYQPVMLIAHRDELVRQLAQHMVKAGIKQDEIGIIKSGYPLNLDRMVQVASIQSLQSRIEEVIKIPFGLIVWDECHRVLGETYLRVFEQYPEAVHLGLTATPARTDGRGLGDVFEYMVQGPFMRELIERGHLSPYQLFSDTKALKQDRVNMAVVSNWKKHNKTKMRTIGFCSSIEQSQQLTDLFNGKDIPAAHIDGTMALQQRRQIISQFIKREILILFQVGIFGEGFDLATFAEMEGINETADIGCVMLLRKTESIIQYLQSVGRALRPHNEKEYAVILDFAGLHQVFGMPDDPFRWSLDGVQIETWEAKEQREKNEEFEKEKKPARTKDGELIMIHPSNSLWRLKGYLEKYHQGKAVQFWLQECSPSLDEMIDACRYFLNYKPLWAWYKAVDAKVDLPQNYTEMRAIYKKLKLLNKQLSWRWAAREWNRLIQEGIVRGEQVWIDERFTRRA